MEKLTAKIARWRLRTGGIALSKERIRYVIIWGAAAALLAGSFFLPDFVAGVTDSNTLGSLALIGSESVDIEHAPELGLPERIELIASRNTEIISVNAGNLLNEETAADTAVRELTKLLGRQRFNFDPVSCEIEECEAAFVVDKGNPSLSMTIWELKLSDRNSNSVNVTVDDETGVILKLIYRFGTAIQAEPGSGGVLRSGKSDIELQSIAQALTELMTDYYGMPVALGGYDFRGSISYYRADLDAGMRIIPMYGVVRVTDFTMNER